MTQAQFPAGDVAGAESERTVSDDSAEHRLPDQPTPEEARASFRRSWRAAAESPGRATFEPDEGPSYDEVVAALSEIADAADAAFLQRYFKTGPGEYGEGDVFIGVRVPALRAVVKRLGPQRLDVIADLLESDVHEHRLAGLVALDALFARASASRTRDDDERERLAAFYLGAVRAGRVNNWDLVDASAEFVLGEYLFDRPRFMLFELADSPDLWWRRVAVLSTFAFIKRGDASTTLELASRILDTGDRRDLTQKAVGWMLREVGKRVDRALLIGFLDTNAARMPAVMLSYATEHLDAGARAAYRALRRPAVE